MFGADNIAVTLTKLLYQLTLNDFLCNPIYI